MTNSGQHRGWISRMCLQVASSALVLAVVATEPAQAQTFSVLYSFRGSSDGAYPFAGLVRDKAGSLYGTTSNGGSSSYGLLFKVNKADKKTVLYSFTGGTDGGYPYGGLLQDKKGNLYGTTDLGGTFQHYGTVFKLDTRSTETVLYTFAGGSSDGCNPYGALLKDRAGNLYGTTDGCGSSGYGTVFKIDTSGTETVLHSFAGGSRDGAYPFLGGLLMDKKANLYGVTQKGGTSNRGVVYVLSKSGRLAVLHSFTAGTTDGCYPLGTPVVDKKGNLYGTASGCGSSKLGIVWKVSKTGKETVLHNFAGGSLDGGDPYAGVLMDGEGNLYGATNVGGGTGCLRGGGCGTVYKLKKNGTPVLLHSFAGSDGQYPIGDLIRDVKGNLYGTTTAGGSGQGCNGGCGTVWKLTP